mmetsp:Transcript_40335/g.90449  ORF Transcript_40335/g.90449 Transcript_40335/m.90449 type:complete len:81 (-) Transcript_40335:2687-2929(-)
MWANGRMLIIRLNVKWLAPTAFPLMAVIAMTTKPVTAVLQATIASATSSVRTDTSASAAGRKERGAALRMTASSKRLPFV